MHSDVLNLLDAHLAELQALRDDLGSARQVRPGARHDTATATLESTQTFASLLTRVLTEQY
ncbi:hypothetical protein [Actinoplanes derwentensis]|uniref:Uncharacterized protein n=1 Tax=Actinoplanes derwentensis TaxID=113562 RepID=A0A1H1YGW3_9ACTN|nr:hypothetical protein [Actinoplanes derwentensis]GID81141.1 hypothetical protein Ade03nite_00650 [Actinoplanes derwentensis]SDT20710.1 hypothetical protein SAMN04489716_2850 [Actinoplanes derwentensis]